MNVLTLITGYFSPSKMTCDGTITLIASTSQPIIVTYPFLALHLNEIPSYTYLNVLFNDLEGKTEDDSTVTFASVSVIAEAGACVYNYLSESVGVCSASFICA